MQFTDTASAGNGGVATASANGGAVAIGDVNSGGNAGNAIGVGDTSGGMVCDEWGRCSPGAGGSVCGRRRRRRQPDHPERLGQRRHRDRGRLGW